MLLMSDRINSLEAKSNAISSSERVKYEFSNSIFCTWILKLLHLFISLHTFENWSVLKSKTDYIYNKINKGYFWEMLELRPLLFWRGSRATLCCCDGKVF